jgi:NADH dehydrogenase FAD-containing subunit
MQNQTISPATPTQIVVLGAGYAGLYATLRLARRTRRQSVQITLVNASPTFVERTRLHQQASGQAIPPLRISDLLKGTGVHFVQGRVTVLHPSHQQVTIENAASGHTRHYDYLIYALGSYTTAAALPGGAEHACTLEDHAQCAGAAGTTFAWCTPPSDRRRSDGSGSGDRSG